ncbi:MAG TPA: hypothetical protein VN754_08700, partial [Candidatus Binataceae bacterium]|nr:hypothetical protein [Candidatus Binataceae bacterium]
EAGMDLGLSSDPAESFRRFQSKILTIYDSVTAEFGLRVIDGSADIDEQQRLVRKMVRHVLRGAGRVTRTYAGSEQPLLRPRPSLQEAGKA